MPRLHCPKCHEINEIQPGAPKACDFCGFGHPGGVPPAIEEGPPADPNEGKMPWDDDYDHEYAAQQASMVVPVEEPAPEPVAAPLEAPAAVPPTQAEAPVAPMPDVRPEASQARLADAEVFRPLLSFKRQTVELDGRRLHWQETGLGDDHHVYLDLRSLHAIELVSKVRWGIWFAVAWLGLLAAVNLWIGLPALIDSAAIGIAFTLAGLLFGGLAVFIAARYGRVLALALRASAGQIVVPIRARAGEAAKAFARQAFAAKDALSQPPTVNVEAPIVNVEAPRRRKPAAKPEAAEKADNASAEPPVKATEPAPIEVAVPEPTNGARRAQDISVDDLLGPL